MLKKLQYKLLFLLLLPINLFAQTTTPPEIEWQQAIAYCDRYNNHKDYNIRSEIFVTADSNYIFAIGPSMLEDSTINGVPYTIGTSHVFVVKMGKNGRFIWVKQYQGENLCDFCATNDGGYVLFTANWYPNAGKPAILKIDANGTQVWRKEYYDTGYIGNFGQYSYGGSSYRIRPTMDGGYIAVAITTATTGPWTAFHTSPLSPGLEQDVLVFKINSTGVLQWSKVLGGSQNEMPVGIVENPDGSFILGIRGGSFDDDGASVASLFAIRAGFWLCKLSATGTIIDNTVIGGSEETLLFSIEKTNDGNLILEGTTRDCDDIFTYTPALGNVLPCHTPGQHYENGHAFTIKMAPDFSIIWKKRKGGSQLDEGIFAAPTPDGGYISCIFTNSSDYDATGNTITYPNSYNIFKNTWLVKHDASGNTEWQKIFGHSTLPYQARATPDGGYILMGILNYTQAPRNFEDECGNLRGENSQYWIVKLKGLPPPPRIDGITTIDCHSTTTLTAIQDEPVPTPVKRYEWNTGATTQAIQVTAAAGTSTYTVTITYQNRCTKVVSVQVNVLGILAITPTINPAICTASSGSIALDVTNGTAPYSYAWNIAGAAVNATNLTAGTYTVTATDANNCTGSASFTVPHRSDTLRWLAPTISPQICTALGSFSVAANNGTAPYVYQSNAPSGGNTASGLTAGVYSVSATDANGCTGSTSLQVMLESGSLTASATSTQPLCAAQTGSIAVSPQGGTAPYTVLPAVLTGLNSGTYTVSVSDANGCNTTASATIAAPPPLAATLQTQNGTCGLQNGSIAVLPQGGTPPYTISPTVLTGLSAGNYSVQVSDAHNCSTMLVTTLTAAPPITAELTVTNPICYGDASGSILVNNIQNATSPLVFSIDNSVFSPQNPLTNIGAGQHQFVLQDAINCTFSESVSIAEGYQINLNIGRDTALYLNDNLLLNATISSSNTHPPYTIAWSFNQTVLAANPTNNLEILFAPHTNGQVSATVTDVNGCTATTTISVAIKDGSAVYIPNAISPNGDGNNDFFAVFGGVNVKEIRLLRIFDRYGELVHEKHNFAPNTPAWNGTWSRYANTPVAPAWGGQGGVGFGFSKSEAAIDVYAVYIEIELTDGNTKSFVQDLTVLR